MSEYQYYEFAALDQVLTSQQQAELRAVSTRDGQVTVTSRGGSWSSKVLPPSKVDSVHCERVTW